MASIWSGASAVYDRHNMYHKLHDYRLSLAINDVLAVNKSFDRGDCVLDIAVFNGDILLAGHLPSVELHDELRNRLTKIKGYRRLFNYVVLSNLPSNSIQDSWITTKIRSQIFADSSIDPNVFKIVTSDRIVYLMGDVQPDQAEKVIKFAQLTNQVERVVTLLKYFTYEEKKHGLNKIRPLTSRPNQESG